MTRIRGAGYLTLAALLMASGSPVQAAVQVLDNKIGGTLYLIDVPGAIAGTNDSRKAATLATSLSSDGEVVGYAVANNTSFRALVSAAVNTTIPATVINDGSDIVQLRTFGVNAAGTIIGDAKPRPTNAAPNPPLQAFKMNPSGPVQLIPDTSIANGINASGQIVGQDNQGRAFLFEANGTQKSLADTLSEARAINDGGLVVGWRDVNGEQQAFVYDGSVTHDLFASLPDASRASAINSQGDIAGTVTTRQGSGGGGGSTDDEAFLLRAGAGTPEALGLASGFDDSFATGVNAERWVVGNATGNGQNQETAWLWVDGQLFDLSAQLHWNWVEEKAAGTPAGPNGIQDIGWVRLLGATAVGSSGQIVGEGWYQFVRDSRWQQERRAFYLAVDVDSIPAIPEPGIYLMLLSGLVAIGVVRLRRFDAH